MILRNYKEEDAAVICRWIRTEEELYRWSADRFNVFPVTEKVINDNYGQQIGTGRLFPLTAVDENDRILGHLIIRYPKEEDDSSVRFGFVIVSPEIRGQGLGSRMLRLAIRYAGEHLGVRRIDLGVFADNDSARHCYEAVGFREYGRRSFEMPIGVWECIDMEMFLE